MPLTTLTQHASSRSSWRPQQCFSKIAWRRNPSRRRRSDITKNLHLLYYSSASNIQICENCKNKTSDFWCQSVSLSAALGLTNVGDCSEKRTFIYIFVKCFGKSKKDYNTICRFNDGSSCGNNPSISYLKTVSIKDPELRAVEIPRDRERRPLICSATTLVEILLIWLWLMMILTHLLNHIKNEVPQGPGEMKRLSVRMES